MLENIVPIVGGLVVIAHAGVLVVALLSKPKGEPYPTDKNGRIPGYW